MNMNWKRLLLASLGLWVGLWPSLAGSQPGAPRATLSRFDQEHDLAKKESLLREITSQYPHSGPGLLKLAQVTTNVDTRWMALRGIRDLHFVEAAPFLAVCLQDPDHYVRANAARTLGDLRIQTAIPALILMFKAEHDEGAIQQAALAFEMLRARESLPYIREKIPEYSGQTRMWLLGALGVLGTRDDVPLIAGYLDSDADSAMAAVSALEAVTGEDFGHGPGNGPTPSLSPSIARARVWWQQNRGNWR